MRTEKPFVQVKMASSLDGGTAMASGESKWITGSNARTDVQRFRAQACAIVTGVGTVLADDPSLNVRLPEMTRQPSRIILDTHLQTPLNSKLLSLPGETIIVHCNTDQGRIAALEQAGALMVHMPEASKGKGIDLEAFLTWAGQRYNRLWVEAGATLAASFITEHLADEVVLYQAPVFLGQSARPLLKHNIIELADKVQFTVLDHRFVGTDVRWVLQPNS
jgi:diaminohydroxyphosphoribosylaminopyrimidine deaminase/5-amino-6-(5-phosphoribosylamino)uracil reductase